MRKVINKLVRDKIETLLKQSAEDANTHVTGYAVRHLSHEEIIEELKMKLTEEVNELLTVYDKDPVCLKEEIADVMEVIDAILYHKNIRLEEVLEIRDVKKEERGGFETGLFLESKDYLDEHP